MEGTSRDYCGHSADGVYRLPKIWPINNVDEDLRVRFGGDQIRYLAVYPEEPRAFFDNQHTMVLGFSTFEDAREFVNKHPTYRAAQD